MSNLRFQTKSNEVAEICYYDEVANSWIPITKDNPLPVGGNNATIPSYVQIVDNNGNPVGVVLKYDGTYMLNVQTVADPESVQQIKAASYDTQTVPLKIQSNNKKIEELLLRIIQELEQIRISLNEITEDDMDYQDLSVTKINQI